MKKTVIVESDNGSIFRAEKIPNTLFNFYILKRKREFKDGTSTWQICVEYAANKNRYMVLDTIRGKRKDAEHRLDQILNGKV